jgi:iron complex outermembrane receptor protein
MDGRAVYSTLLAGTFWEVQDTILEDVDRIEVIRGPGGILWGANAVNGIVNIITKDAGLTQGLLATVGGGSEEQGFFSLRYGGGAGENLRYRFYGKFFRRDTGFRLDGNDLGAWRTGQIGFRNDWALPDDRSLILQGDFYVGRSGQLVSFTTYEPPFVHSVEEDIKLSGGNVLARYSGAIGPMGGATFQFYYDRANRRSDSATGETRDTIDFDFQENLNPSSRMDLTWGLGYRVSSGRFFGIPTVRLEPDRRTDHLISGFVQDEIELLPDRLFLIGGSKFEHNGYSGFEWQPNGKFLWTPSANHTVRLSAARAVRTPSRAEEDLEITALLRSGAPAAFLRLLPNQDFLPEKLRSYELGYRVRPIASLYTTASVFFNEHHDLLSSEIGTPFAEENPAPLHAVLPVQRQNLLEGNSYGAEFVGDWRPVSWWRLTGSYSHLRIQLRTAAHSRDVSSEAAWEGRSPRHQVGFHSSMNLLKGVEFDWILRYLSRLSSLSIPSYTTSDVRLGWRPDQFSELSIVGQNLHQPHHKEFSGGVEVERSIYGKATWQW